ncbi:hypothetical protein CVT25_013235 [Psilocybe cyanescens]|uniref:Uncharacterized protein n=1 Tax=Psilocybe cyanescens TaxID=93625 RepID=A0A409XLT5_PSICY|nr:hypothetical protein CVT25_013235 [Psilocybe cyanescens]
MSSIPESTMDTTQPDSFDSNFNSASNSIDNDFNVDFFFGDENAPGDSSFVPNPSVLSTLSFKKNPPAPSTAVASSESPATPATTPNVPVTPTNTSSNSVAPTTNAPSNVNDVTSVYPSLKTIAHPGVCRIKTNRFVIFDPSRGFTRCDAQQALTTKLLAAYCAYDRKLCALTDKSIKLDYIPYGYPSICKTFNDYAVGPERFSYWSNTSQRYITDGRPITIAKFKPLTLPAIHHPKLAKQQPTSTEFAPRLSNNSDPANCLFNDMILLSASAETARRKQFDHYFHKRSIKRQNQKGAKIRKHQAPHHSNDSVFSDFDFDMLDESQAGSSTTNTL